MSTTQYEANGITVSTYAGPKDGDKPRKRVQIAVGETFVQMSLEQWDRLYVIRNLLGPTCQGYHLGRDNGE